MNDQSGRKHQHDPGAGHTTPGDAPDDTGSPVISVLYVDDEPTLLEPIKLALEKRGNITVDTFSDARDALVTLQKRSYDVIVSDYQMPEMDGITFLKHVRERGDQTPFIVFTGKGREDAVIEAYDAGADFYLSKGGNPKAMYLDLTKKIEQVYTRRNAEKALRESEERYRKVMEQSHDAIFITRGSHFVFVNNRVSEISGYPKSELYTMEIWDLLHPEDRERVIEISRKRTGGGPAPQTYEARVITKNGEVRHLEFAVTTLIFSGENALLCSVRDITERKISEEALRKSEEKYRSIFNTFDDLYYQTDMRGIITTLSPSCKKITGWDPSELIGRQVQDLYPFPDQRKLLLDEMFTNGAVHDYEVTLKSKDGRYLQTSVTSHIVRDGNGNPLAVEGTLRDTTERKQVVDALHASEEKYRTLADFLPVMVFEADLEGRVTFANRLTYPTFGIDPADIISGIRVTDYVVPEDRLTVKENMQALFRGEERGPSEYTLMRKDGSRFPAMIRASAVLDKTTGRPTGLRGAIIDLTERRQKDEALRQSEASYHGLFNAVKDAICILDKSGIFIDANKGAEEMFIYPRSYFIGKTLAVLSAGDRSDMEKAGAWIRKACEELESPQFEFRGRRSTGDEILTDVRLYRGTYFGQDVVIALLVDITERKKAESALRESEELFRALFNNANDAIFLHGMLPGGEPGQYIMVNDIACSRLGYTREELLTKSPFDIVSPTHVPNMQGIARTVKLHDHATFDAIHRRKDGTEFPVEISTHLFELHGRKLSLSIARDRTERQRMEEALRASEQQLHAIIDGSSIPQFVISRDHTVIYWNKALEKYSGISATEIRGTSDAWKAFYQEKRPLLADLLIDNDLTGIPFWYKDKYKPAKYVEGAFEATDFFPRFGKKGTWLHFTAIAIRDRTGAIIGALETLEDITDRRNAEEELKGSEQYLKTIFHSVQTGLLIIDPRNRTIVDANPAAVRLIGAERSAIIGVARDAFREPPLQDMVPLPSPDADAEPAESILITTDKKRIPVLKSIIPVTISGEQFLLENIMDITDRKRAEDALQTAYAGLEKKVEERTRELSLLTGNLQKEITERNRVMEALAASEEKYRSLVEQIGDIVFHIDQNGFITYVSPHVLTDMGISTEQVPKLNVFDLAPPGYRDAIAKFLDPAPATHEPVSGFEIELPVSSQGKRTIYEINATPSYAKDGSYSGYSGIARDITERRSLQDAVTASLKEKEILLKEIHHRVKNNMQVISSLLSLQVKLMKDKKSREALLESQNRVMSIALVHEKLYQSKSFAEIDYYDYLKKITENLFQSYGIPKEKIHIEIHAEKIVLPISKAIPISLMINEILSNSMKYAFPGERRGVIVVDLQKTGDRYILVVKDDGIGLPEGIDLDHIETLGLQLVNSLVGQILGTVTLNRTGGTEFKIEFTIEPAERGS